MKKKKEIKKLNYTLLYKNIKEMEILKKFYTTLT